jgi:Ser/Thr protein kinase RdoA (MazF antagonist)
VWSSSAGRIERLVVTNKIKVEIPSKNAWAASLSSAKLPVAKPATPSNRITEMIATSDTLRARVFMILGDIGTR